MIALRREPFDFGILPASFLLPRAESVAALAPIRRRLLQCAHPSRHDPTKLVVSVTDAAQCMGIAPQHAEHVIDTMHAVAPAEPAPHPAEDDGLPVQLGDRSLLRGDMKIAQCATRIIDDFNAMRFVEGVTVRLAASQLMRVASGGADDPARGEQCQLPCTE